MDIVVAVVLSLVVILVLVRGFRNVYGNPSAKFRYKGRTFAFTLAAASVAVWFVFQLEVQPLWIWPVLVNAVVGWHFIALDFFESNRAST